MALAEEKNELKRSKTDLHDLKLSKTTKNNEYKNLIDTSKVFVLDFRTQVGGMDSVHVNLKTKNRPVSQTLKPDAVIQSRPRTFRPM